MRTIGDQIALAGTITAQLDLTGDARHRHIPGSPYEWRHGWIPLTRAAAESHFRGHVPSSWHPASAAGRLSAPAQGRHEETVKVPDNPRAAMENGVPGSHYVTARVRKTYGSLGRDVTPADVGATFTPYDDRTMAPDAARESAHNSNDRYRPNVHHQTHVAVHVLPIPGSKKVINLDSPKGRELAAKQGRLSAPGKREETVKAGRMGEPSAGEAGRQLLKDAAARHGVKVNELEYGGKISTHAKMREGITLISHETNEPGKYRANGQELKPEEVEPYLAAHAQNPNLTSAELLDRVRGTRGGVEPGKLTADQRAGKTYVPPSLQQHSPEYWDELHRQGAESNRQAGLPYRTQDIEPRVLASKKPARETAPEHAAVSAAAGRMRDAIRAAAAKDEAIPTWERNSRAVGKAAPAALAAVDAVEKASAGDASVDDLGKAMRALDEAMPKGAYGDAGGRLRSEQGVSDALGGLTKAVVGRQEGIAMRGLNPAARHVQVDWSGNLGMQEGVTSFHEIQDPATLRAYAQQIAVQGGKLVETGKPADLSAVPKSGQQLYKHALAHGWNASLYIDRDSDHKPIYKVVATNPDAKLVSRQEFVRGKRSTYSAEPVKKSMARISDNPRPQYAPKPSAPEAAAELPAKAPAAQAAAPSAPAHVPDTISEQLAMFGERTTSGKDVTSGAEGTLAPGDWHAGYQAIGAAPLDALPSERSRQVDVPGSKYGVNVKGAWSDPMWVAKPGGGFAISARWKSKAQKVSVYGGGPARTVDHPAMDERVIIPVDAQGRTAKQSAEQELKAEQARQAKAAADKAEAARKADAARAERQAAAAQKRIEEGNRAVAAQRQRNDAEAARKVAGAQTARDRGLTEGARVFVDSGKHKGGIATVRSVGPDGRTMVEHYGGDLETMAPDHLRTQPSGAEETRRMNAVHEADKAKQQMAEQAQREREAGERNARGMDRMMARSAAGRQHFQEVTGFPFPQQERFAPDITEAEGLLSRGKLAEGAAALDRAIAAHEASQRGRVTKADQARVDRVRKLRDKVAAAAANPRPTLPALAKVHGTNRKGSFTALDHAGNEYKIGLDPATKQVSVTRDGKTLTAPAGDDPTYMARLLAGNLAGTSPVLGTASSGSPVRAGDRVATNVRFGMGRGTLEGTVQGGKGIVMGATPDGKLRILADDGKRLITAKPSEVVRAKNLAEGGDSGPAFGTIGQQLAAREPAKPAGRDYVVTSEKNPPGKSAVTGLRRMTLAEARQSQFASTRASSRRHVVHADTLAPDTGAVDSVQAATAARYSSPAVRDQVDRAIAAYTYGNYEDARASASAALRSETNAAARAAISRLVRVIEEDRAQAVPA